MSLKPTVLVDASVDVSLRVPRGEAGNLESGVADVIANADGARDVSVERVTSVRPMWTDIHVDADVRLSIEVASDATDRPDAVGATVGATLEDAFGVTEVNALVVDEDE